MSQAFSGKIKSARFADTPTNSVIEILYSQEGDSVLTQFHLHVNFSDPTFLDFIEEWPLEKIEKASKDASKVADGAVPVSTLASLPTLFGSSNFK